MTNLGKDFNELGQIYSGSLIIESTEPEKKPSLEDVVAEEEEVDKTEEETVEETKSCCSDDPDDSCGYGDDDKETVEEETDDEDEESDEETVEEGIGDRVKATVGGVKAAAGDYLGGVGDALRGGAKASKKDPSKKFEDTKRQRIFESHLKKIKNDLSSFVTDLVKLGLMEEAEAEAFAKGAYDSVANTFTSANKNRALKGRQFRG